MKTNKFFKSMLALCCGLIVSGSLVSCNNDDNEIVVTKDDGDNRELATAEIIYKVSLGKYELAVNDVVVTYLDKEGKQHSLTMTENEWTWKCDLTAADDPANFELRVKPTRKGNLNVDDNTKYEVGVMSKIIVKVRNKAGRLICNCDGLGIDYSGFHEYTGEQLKNEWSSTVTGWFDGLTNTNKKAVKVYPDKIVYNKMTQKYW